MLYDFICRWQQALRWKMIYFLWPKGDVNLLDLAMMMPIVDEWKKIWEEVNSD